MVNKYEVSKEFFDEESVLYSREKDHSKGTYAPQCRVSSAEGIRFY